MFAAIGAFFDAVIYQPRYNALVALVGAIPTHDIGIAVIILTIIVRIILFPLSRRAIEAQLAMKKIAPEIEKLKAKHKGKREEESKAILGLYKERGVHPFASIGLVLVQFPVLIGLYWVFYRGGFPHVNAALLYPFVHVPAAVNMTFLGLVDMSKRNVILAVAAAITQFLYTRLSMGPREKVPEG